MSGSDFWEYTADNMAHVALEFLQNPSHREPKTQDKSMACSAPRIAKNHLKNLSRVCPHVQTADQIFNIARCLDLYNSSVVVSWQDKAMKLVSVCLINDPHVKELGRTRLRTGQFVYWDGLILVKCAGDTVLGVSKMVLPFKKVISAAQFYRDHCNNKVEKVFHMVYSSNHLDSITVPQKIRTLR